MNTIQKTEVVDFIAKHSIKTKVIVNYTVLAQLSHFNYLGCDIRSTYNYHKDVNTKTERLQNAVNIGKQERKGKQNFIR